MSEEYDKRSNSSEELAPLIVEMAEILKRNYSPRPDALYRFSFDIIWRGDGLVASSGLSKTEIFERTT